MADVEEKQEKGTSLMFAGAAVWAAGFLVLFYLPAGMRLGHLGRFEAILIGLGVLGAVLMGVGWKIRRQE
jgi:hypothetical protein